MIEFRSLQSHEIDAWLDQITLVFSEGKMSPWLRTMFENAWIHDPDKDLQGIRVAVEGDKILSSVQVVKRRIFLCEQEVPMGGIAAVSTLVEARRQGLSTRLLQDSIHLMEAWNQPVSMLQTGIHPFYGRLGWEQIPYFVKTLRLKPGPYTVLAEQAALPSDCTLRPLDFAADLPQVAGLYAAYSSRFHGTVVRSLAYWRKFAANPPDRWWVAEISGELAAFLCLDVENERVSVAEFGALPGREALFDALLGRGLEAFGPLPESIRCPAVIESKFEVAGWHESPYWMARLNRPLEVAGQRLETTRELIALMSGSPEPGKQGHFMFWGNDGF